MLQKVTRSLPPFSFTTCGGHLRLSWLVFFSGMSPLNINRFFNLENTAYSFCVRILRYIISVDSFIKIHVKHLCSNISIQHLDVAPVDGHFSQSYLALGIATILKRRSSVLRSNDLITRGMEEYIQYNNLLLNTASSILSY